MPAASFKLSITGCEIVPTPVERVAKTVDGKELKADPSGPLAAFVFKSTADPYVGKLTYFKVYSGTLKSDSHVWNAAKGKDERIGQVLEATRGDR